MTVTNVAHTTGSGVNGFTSASVDTTGASLLVLAVVSYAVSPVVTGSISDSKGNTWTALTASTVTADTQTQLFYVANPTVGSGHTVTINQTGCFCAATFSAWSDIATATPVAGENGATSSSATSIQVGSVTPANGGDLCLTAVGLGGSYSSLAIDSSFSIQDQIAYSGGVNYGIGVASLVTSNTNAQNPTWSWSSAVSTAARHAIFKAATPVTASQTSRRMLLGVGR